MLYARANPVHTGQRYVQLSTADQGSVGPLLPSEEGVSTWSPFQMIRIDNYAYCDGDIYFFLVQQNPVLADSLLALFPVVHRSSGCIAFAVSRDGVRWSAPAPLLRCATDDYGSPGSRVKLGSRHSHTHVGQRSLHQPAANLHLVGSEAVVFVHEHVPGISHTPGAKPRLKRWAFPASRLREWSRALLAEHDARPAWRRAEDQAQHEVCECRRQSWLHRLAGRRRQNVSRLSSKV